MFKRLFLIPCLLLFAGSAFSQGIPVPEDLQAHPGYIEFSSISTQIDEEPNIEIFLKGPLLRLVAEASSIEDPDLARMLHKLEAIRVLAYDMDEVSSSSEDQLLNIGRALSQEMTGANWEPVARIREDDERVYIYFKTLNDSIQGLTVVAIDSRDEAVFVNIVGEINPEEVGRIGRKFNVDVLDDVTDYR